MKKILVIEDDHIMRKSIIRILKVNGYETVSASDGRFGVELARKHIPDLIICDILMPRLNGFGVLVELRGDPQTVDIPFIFLTAQKAKKDFRKSMRMGADDYLTKPFDKRELLASIKARLEKRAAITKKWDDLRLTISSMLPHELRTPLSVIIGCAELLRMTCETPDEEQIIQMVEVFHGAALRLQRLIENYLFFTKLQLIKYESENRKQWKNEQAIIEKDFFFVLATKYANEIERKDDLILELTEAAIQFSARDMKKIVEELMDNAFKFSANGTQVRLMTIVDDNKFRLNVSNRGRGMTKEQITNIGAFTQFERSKFEQQGSGLGLAIVHLLTDLHDGSLTIESVLDQETTVSVEFTVTIL